MPGALKFNKEVLEICHSFYSLAQVERINNGNF
uniref:Uncharacterized protein n=1 Tax=Siphoviridae sp. ct9Dg3 TaxID=2827792 RepID=A0A8S5TLK9_9CAUD|nr:MAG TPA: hypothetical protein [Siphoviridae sp. ct9Dg3]